MEYTFYSTRNIPRTREDKRMNTLNKKTKLLGIFSQKKSPIPLTARQQEILDLVMSELNQGRSFPSLNWIAGQVGIKTKRGVAIHLDALEKKGYINRNTQYFELRNQKSFPFATGLSAGLAQEAFDSNESISFDPDYFGRGSLVAISISGESMAGDSIHDGDVVIIKLLDEQKEHSKNDILAVRIDNQELTLKRINQTDGMIELIPSNPDFKPHRYSLERVSVIGKYVGLVRKN